MLKRHSLSGVCLAAVLLFAVAYYPSNGQVGDTIRVGTYNLLHFDKDEEERIVYFRLILEALRADVLMVQETTASVLVPEYDGQLHFIRTVAKEVNEAYVADVVGVPGQDTYVMILYDQDKFEYMGTRWVVVEPRISAGVKLRLKATGDTILFFTLDLNEGATQDDRNYRSFAVNDVRDSLASWYNGKNIVLGGSFNIYDTAEVAYGVLTRPRRGDSLFVDPIQREGFWSNNPEFSDVHTSSTRVRSFGGGADGGLRHRFDQIFISRTLQGNYVPGSYTTFGNDRLHFGDSVNAGTNAVVSTEIADALHAASDHLPVYLDLVFDRISTGVPNEVEKRKEKDRPDLH